MFAERGLCLSAVMGALSVPLNSCCLKLPENIVSSLWGLHMKELDNKQDSRQQMAHFKCFLSWSEIMCFYFIYLF